MPATTTIQHHMPAENLEAWLSQHPAVAIGAGAFSLWISVSLILRMWLVHRRATIAKKVVWSFLLLVPVFGWVFYAGCFQPPGYTDIPIPPTPESMSGG